MSQQSQRVSTAIRSMIIKGDLAPGERITETPIAERLGVSRMPVRMALPALEQEGLLEKAGKRGYRVRRVGAADIAGAIEVRGSLEGLAARLVAENGLGVAAREALAKCLREGDAIFVNGRFDDGDVTAYHDLNMRFHRIILEASNNKAIEAALARNDGLPFASANSMAVDRDHPVQEFQRLHFAHMQHHIIFEALVAGQGARAEAVMREHANAALKYVELFTDISSVPDNLRLIVGGAR